MFELKTILVPIDFSERSAAAAEHAAVMAEHFDARLIFLHAVPPGPYEHGVFELGYSPASIWPDPQEIEEKLSEQMEDLIKKTARGRQVKSIVAWGDPTAKVEATALAESADLILMPTHGYGPFRRFALGSVTNKVLHDLSLPVFTGAHVEGPHHVPTGPYKTIACAVDLRPHSMDVLRWAQGFSQSWDASLHVIHAAPCMEKIPVGEHLPADLPDTIVRLKKEETQKLMEQVGASGDLHVECEDPVAFVVSVVEELEADILIIGRSSDDSLIGRLRTESGAIIREAPCPVISI